MDVSTENVGVFAWHRHGRMTLDQAAEIVRQSAALGLFHKFEFDPGFLAGKVIVDAGCGGGLKTNAFALAGADRAIGVDGSDQALTAARALAAHLDLSNVSFRQGMLEDLNAILADVEGQIDVVVCNQVIHHCSDYRPLLDAFAKLLKPGGHLWVNFLSVGLCWGHYILKNQLTFGLGGTPEGRLQLGKSLFGWWDQRYNRQAVDEDSFFADRYAAYYKILFLGQMRRALERRGFRVLGIDPPVDILELVRRRHPARDGIYGPLERLAQANPLVRAGANAAIRAKQFTEPGGGMRGLLCVKATGS